MTHTEKGAMVATDPNGLRPIGRPGTAGSERELRRWLGLYQQLGPGDSSWTYPSFAHLVAAHGIYQEPAPWTQEEVQQPGRCFEAASQWAERMGWTYVEGFALLPSTVPFACFEHAWCVDGNTVTDPSLPDGTAIGYLGIALTHAFRREQQTLRGTNAVFVSDPKNPLAGVNEDVLRKGLPPQALI